MHYILIVAAFVYGAAGQSTAITGIPGFASLSACEAAASAFKAANSENRAKITTTCVADQ